MEYKISFVIISLLFYLRLHAVSCLKCHVCSSANPSEVDCNDVKPTDTKYLMNCDGPANASCRIQEQWVEFEVLKQKTDKRTIRQCATVAFDPVRPCYYRAGFGGKVNVCNCLGDGCNGASKTMSTLIMTIGTLLLFKFLI